MRLIFVLLCLLCALPCLAAPPAVVVVLLPPATLQGWQSAEAPTLHRLMQTGALGVMNTRTAHQAGRQERETPQAALLTLAAGSRAAAAVMPCGFLPASSPAPGTGVSAAALFERRTGVEAGPGQSVCLEWAAVLAANHSLGYDLRLGSFADTLTAHGVSVVSGGGPDADWLAAGGDGAVHPVPALRAEPGRCLVWDAGPDTASADKVLADAAAQVAALQGRLVVYSPLGGDAAPHQLAPVLVWGPGIPAGLLHSPSTRRPGLVTDTDFAPSVAALFGISRTQFRSVPFGFAWSPEAAPNAARTCRHINSEAVRQSQGMRLLPYTAAALGIWLVCVTLLTARFAVPVPALFVPISVLTAALFAGSAAAFGLLLITVLFLLTLSSRLIGSARLLTAASVFLTAAVCADAATGNVLMHRGLLGYSALEGARYYGIGNEAMGLLLGAALVAAARLWPTNKPARLALLAAMAGIVILLGTAGAKAGGVLVSLAVFGTFLLAVLGWRLTAKTLVLLAGALLAGIAAAALGDAVHAGTHSHIGEAIRRITSGGPEEGWDIVRRKLAVEGRLAYHSAWAALLWLGLLCTVWLWRTTPAADNREKALRLAGGVGIAACLLLNDAGVVAAAIFAALLWSAAMTQKSLPVLDVSRTGRH